MKSPKTTDNRERVLLVGIGRKRASRVPGVEAGDVEREALLELAELTQSAGGNVVGSMLQLRDSPDPATLVGKGKVDEIKAEATFRKASVVIFDSNLTPTQQRNIDKLLD